MTQPELVLDLSVDGLSLWQPAEAADWLLLGFASLDDPELPEKIAAMRLAGTQAAGPDFATMLLLPDDHMWVQRLQLKGFTASALDASARQALARATALPLTGFSLAFGDTNAEGATAVAATTTEVLEEARKFARDNGFNPTTVASRSFFDGFSARAIFGDAPKPLTFLPRRAPAPAPRPDQASRPKRRPLVPNVKLPRLPKISRQWLLGGIGAVSVVAAATYWAIDPFEQFLRPPNAAAELAEFDLPDDQAGSPAVPLDLAAPRSVQVSPRFTVSEPQANSGLAAANIAPAGGETQVTINFDPQGVFFTAVPTPPKAPASLGDQLSWTAPAAMFLETPDAEPAIGVAAMQKLPVLEMAAEVPQDSGLLDNVLLSAVSTRSVSGLASISSDAGLALPSAEPGVFAYRDAASALSSDVLPLIVAGLAEAEPAAYGQTEAPAVTQLAALSGPLVPDATSDVLFASPQPAFAAPGNRPLARPGDFAVIHPSEAVAALTPASAATVSGQPMFGPEWPGPAAAVELYPVTEFVAGRPGHVRPKARPEQAMSALAFADRPVFGPLWPGAPSAPAGVIEFDAANSAHVRPLPRTPELVAKAAAAAAQASIIALNLPADAALDVGLGWQEYNPDNPAHVRPQVRPSSLQQLAEQGNLAPTAFAIKTSIRPAVRPASIAAIMLARAEEIAAAQAAATEAETRAQAVAEAAALALAESQPETAAANIDPDLAALDDAEPETDVQVASLPTSASVAEAATTDGGLDRGEISLIGIYGTESKRRALVRLPSGRYERVTVGDSFSGWKVAAIGDDAIRIVKGGNDEILRMPD